jgi:hypothetical protein
MIDTADVVVGIDQQLGQRTEHRRVLGSAAGHHRRGGQVLPSDLQSLRRDLTDDVVDVPPQRVEHVLDEVAVRRDDGKAVRPTAGEAAFQVFDDLGCRIPRQHDRSIRNAASCIQAFERGEGTCTAQTSIRYLPIWGPRSKLTIFGSNWTA